MSFSCILANGGSIVCYGGGGCGFEHFVCKGCKLFRISLSYGIVVLDFDHTLVGLLHFGLGFRSHLCWFEPFLLEPAPMPPAMLMENVADTENAASNDASNTEAHSTAIAAEIWGCGEDSQPFFPSQNSEENYADDEQIEAEKKRRAEEADEEAQREIDSLLATLHSDDEEEKKRKAEEAEQEVEEMLAQINADCEVYEAEDEEMQRARARDEVRASLQDDSSARPLHSDDEEEKKRKAEEAECEAFEADERRVMKRPAAQQVMKRPAAQQVMKRPTAQQVMKRPSVRQ